MCVTLTHLHVCDTHTHLPASTYIHAHSLTHTHTCIRVGREGERDERIESVGERARETARVCAGEQAGERWLV